jgi:tetratricopeptide (TPR) repeat protein
MARYDRDAPTLLARGDTAALLSRYRGALWMRLFSPTVLVAERRGVMEMESGRPAEALRAYRAAVIAYQDPQGVPAAVWLGYAQASQAVGDDVTAIDAFEKALPELGHAPATLRDLALSLARLGEDPERALEVAARAATLGGKAGFEDECLLIQGIAHLQTGDPEQAQALLDAVRPAASDRARLLHDELTKQLAARKRDVSAPTSSRRLRRA